MTMSPWRFLARQQRQLALKGTTSMFKHQPSGPKRSRFGKQRPAPPSRRLYRGLKVEGLETGWRGYSGL